MQLTRDGTNYWLYSHDCGSTYTAIGNLSTVQCGELPASYCKFEAYTFYSGNLSCYACMLEACHFVVHHWYNGVVLPALFSL